MAYVIDCDTFQMFKCSNLVSGAAESAGGLSHAHAVVGAQVAARALLPVGHVGERSRTGTGV